MQFDQFIKSILNKLGLSINKLPTFVELVTNKVAYKGAAEIFSQYIENYENFNKDSDLKGFIDFYLKNWKYSSSQWGQDIFVLYFSKKKKNGRYLEIGGADGFTHSNTYALNKFFNWSGVLVEPHNSMFATLQKVRTSDHLINSAISPAGVEKFVLLRKSWQLSSVVGYEANDNHADFRLSSKKIQKAKAISINSLLSTNQFDYFSLDVEGSELSILKSVDWVKVNKPSLVTIEYNFNENYKKEILELMNKQGYKSCFERYDWIRRADLWFKYEGN